MANYNSIHTGAIIDSTVTKFKDQTIQSSATDTTAGTIALQGNDADFASLTADTVTANGSVRGGRSTSQYLHLTGDASSNKLEAVSSVGVPKPFIITPDINSTSLQLRTATANPILLMPNGSETVRIDSSGNVGVGTGSPSTDLHVNGPIRCGSYTVATVPSAATVGAGSIIYVTDEFGGATHAASDGTNWRRMSDRATIS